MKPSYPPHQRMQLSKLLCGIVLVVLAMLLPGCSGPPTVVGTWFPTISPTSTLPPKASDTIAPVQANTPKPSLTPTATLPLAIMPLKTTTVERYGMLELDLLTTLQVKNPYDPDEIDIRVQFNAPSGRTVEVGAFWYQDFEYQLRIPQGDPGWKARFTPTETGTWTAAARVEAQGQESNSISFTVVESEDHGFVRIHPTNPRFFAFEDGSTFFPIGLNIAWWSGAGNAIDDYTKWMDPFASNGGDLIRVWMAEWSFGIEWIDTPLGNYDNRQKRMWYLDQVFQMAEQRDIFIMLTLLNCADFNDWQTNGWNNNPYNAKNGGPLKSPEEFATDVTARARLEKRLNYIVNRWGYSTHLLAWEWWNEVNLAGIPDQLLFPWYQEMTAYLKNLDVNKHLVTNSYAISDTHPSWLLPEMEIIQKHEYAHQEATTNKDLAERVVADLATLVGGAPPKPALLDDFGYGTESWGKDVDKTGIHLHNGIWATTFAGYAGSGLYWFWDVYVEVYRVWGHFKGLDRFLEDVDMAEVEPFSPLIISPAGQAYGLGLHGEDTLVWIRSNAYTVQAAEAAWDEGRGSAFYSPPVVEGLVLTLEDIVDGSYTISWYDPQMARWLDEVEVTAQNGTLAIPVPSFNIDIAAKILLTP